MFFELLIALREADIKMSSINRCISQTTWYVVGSFVAGSLMRMNGLQSTGTDPLSHSHHPSNGRMLQRCKVTPLPQLFCLMRYHKMSTSSKVVVMAAEIKCLLSLQWSIDAQFWVGLCHNIKLNEKYRFFMKSFAL